MRRHTYRSTDLGVTTWIATTFVFSRGNARSGRPDVPWVRTALRIAIPARGDRSRSRAASRSGWPRGGQDILPHRAHSLPDRTAGLRSQHESAPSRSPTRPLERLRIAWSSASAAPPQPNQARHDPRLLRGIVARARTSMLDSSRGLGSPTRSTSSACFAAFRARGDGTAARSLAFRPAAFVATPSGMTTLCCFTSTSGFSPPAASWTSTLSFSRPPSCSSGRRNAPPVRSRWDVVLVDEFQDLNPVQYRVVRALAADHQHVFAVGDNEQSIYSWAGADPALFTSLVNDFGLSSQIYLEENRRCPRDVFALARKLVTGEHAAFRRTCKPARRTGLGVSR